MTQRMKFESNLDQKESSVKEKLILRRLSYWERSFNVANFLWSYVRNEDAWRQLEPQAKLWLNFLITQYYLGSILKDAALIAMLQSQELEVLSLNAWTPRICLAMAYQLGYLPEMSGRMVSSILNRAGISILAGAATTVLLPVLLLRENLSQKLNSGEPPELGSGVYAASVALYGLAGIYWVSSFCHPPKQIVNSLVSKLIGFVLYCLLSEGIGRSLPWVSPAGDETASHWLNAPTYGMIVGSNATIVEAWHRLHEPVLLCLCLSNVVGRRLEDIKRSPTYRQVASDCLQEVRGAQQAISTVFRQVFEVAKGWWSDLQDFSEWQLENRQP